MHIVSLDRLNIHDKVIANTFEKNMLSVCNLKINTNQFLTPHLVCKNKQEQDSLGRYLASSCKKAAPS